MKNVTEFLNSKEAALLLRAHGEMVRRLERRGEIPAFKVGKDWHFRLDVLDRWPEGQSFQ